ncbi:MAG: FHA domain-containing protein [Ardenticatenia bacterium]|nr:FHA domain-containing protein [Ardenticatenia bacterium]
MQLDQGQGAPEDARDKHEAIKAVGGPTLQALLERLPGSLPPPRELIALIDILESDRDRALQGRVVPVTQTTFLIGRDTAEADLVIRDSRVSRRHCKLILYQQGLEVQDLGSANGTFLNGQRLEERISTPIPHGGQLEVGPVKMKVYLWSHLLRGDHHKAKLHTEIMDEKQKTAKQHDNAGESPLQWKIGKRNQLRDSGPAEHAWSRPSSGGRDERGRRPPNIDSHKAQTLRGDQLEHAQDGWISPSANFDKAETLRGDQLEHAQDGWISPGANFDKAETLRGDQLERAQDGWISPGANFDKAETLRGDQLERAQDGWISPGANSTRLKRPRRPTGTCPRRLDLAWRELRQG